MEYKTIGFEIKDMSRESRTAVIAHAVYGVIDRVGDIATKGMFAKSWQETKSIDFLFNHDPYMVIGNVTGVHEDEHKAYTDVSFGKWKLGDDVLEMIDSGVITGASFGYVTERKAFTNIKGRSVRQLKQVKHLETTLTNKTPVNPLAGVVTYTKTEETDGAIKELKASIDRMEKFCRDSNASDKTIESMLAEIAEQKHILSQYDTADTQVPLAPSASVKEFANSIYYLTLNHF